LTNRAQCDAQPGYDGVSGVGTPKGTIAFTAIGPKAVIHPPGTVTHNVTKVFSSSGTSDPFPGGTITKYTWTWGDGSTTIGANPSHTYTTAGTRTITLTVTDNYARTGTTSLKITVT
jgi:PKD repeat protein